MADFGEKIKRARQNNGYTQAQLAHKIGVSTNTISRWEHNAHSPSVEDFKKLSSVLLVDFESDLVSDANDINKMEMQLEDIRLELAGAEKSNRKMIYIIIGIVVAFIVFFVIFVMGIHWIDPNKPDEPATIIYYNVEEGDY